MLLREQIENKADEKTYKELVKPIREILADYLRKNFTTRKTQKAHVEAIHWQVYQETQYSIPREDLRKLIKGVLTPKTIPL